MLIGSTLLLAHGCTSLLGCYQSSLDEDDTHVLLGTAYLLRYCKHYSAVRSLGRCLCSEISKHRNDVLLSFVLLLLQRCSKIIIEIFSHFFCILNYFLYLCKRVFKLVSEIVCKNKTNILDYKTFGSDFNINLILFNFVLI